MSYFIILLRQQFFSVISLITLVFFPLTLYSAPSALCHKSDGEFTVCQDGSTEWSDVMSMYFQETNTYLYGDQADIDPTRDSINPITGEISPIDTFVVLIDDCDRTTPLSPNEYYLLNIDGLDVVDGVDKYAKFSIHAFNDGTITVSKNGSLLLNENGQARSVKIGGRKGHVGFGPSPNCPFDHVIVEHEDELAIAAGNSIEPPPAICEYLPPVEEEEPELPPCPDIGTSSPITLSPVTAPISTNLKPYQVIYGELPLTFTSGAPSGGSSCTVTSNIGELPVLLDLLRDSGPPPIQVATSRTTATLDFFEPGSIDVSDIQRCNFSNITDNCFLTDLPGDSNNIARWTSPGFEISSGPIPIRNTGPRTYYVNLNDFNTGDNFTEVLQGAEQHIHETLINNLSGVDSIAVFQDPPANLLVTSPSGKKSGLTSTGDILNEIPASIYFQSVDVNALMIVEPDVGVYDIELIGDPSSPFSLSMSVAKLFPNAELPTIKEEIEFGNIDPTGTIFQFEIPENVGAIRPGFNENFLSSNDDGSTSAVPMGITANFFGTSYNDVFVNNNGNITFDSPLGTFTPFSLNETGRVIIAPFFADVDTSNFGNEVRYGPGVVNDRPAFGVTWPGVDCYGGDGSVLNQFQVLLIDRSDVGAGDFDIEFNYNSILWETGVASGGDITCQGGNSARVGYSNGSGLSGTFFELPGSGIPGAFLDSNLSTGLVNNSLNSSTQGRYIFSVRSGVPVPGGDDSDGDEVPDDLDNCPNIYNPGQEDININGIGDICEDSTQFGAAGYVTTGLNGITQFEPTPLIVADSPSIKNRLAKIVNYSVNTGLRDSAEQMTTSLVDSLVESGLIPLEDAEGLIEEVLDEIIVPVNIEIKAKREAPNNVQVGKNNFSLVIYTTDDFDATTVNENTVVVGDGATEVHSRSHIGDIDNDGDDDWTGHFSSVEVGIVCGEQNISLTGETFGGMRIAGNAMAVGVGRDCP